VMTDVATATEVVGPGVCEHLPCHGAAHRSMCVSLTDSLPSAVLHSEQRRPEHASRFGVWQQTSDVHVPGGAFRR
jgi:hypothetical protein